MVLEGVIVILGLNRSLNKYIIIFIDSYFGLLSYWLATDEISGYLKEIISLTTI